MTKTEYVEYLRSEHWLQRRKLAIDEAGNKCERCELPRWLAALIYDQDLHVHHRNYQHLGDEEWEDLEVLCRRCHDIESTGRSDYRQIKMAKCSLCASSHRNIYANFCDTCLTTFSLGSESFFERLGVTCDGVSLWKNLIADIVLLAQIPVADVLDEIAEAERRLMGRRKAMERYFATDHDASDVPF